MNDERMVSVIIGFKDWGLDRLLLSMSSIHESLQHFPHEIIVSDFGSEDPDHISSLVEAAGGKVVRTETDGTWSRSRALNAGFADSLGDVILATDADMLFSPGALDGAVNRVLEHANELVLLQCRDLPVGFGPETVAPLVGDWATLERVSTLRPRWGMGGLICLTRDQLVKVRGWDERMHTYGGEDVDFARRCQASGMRHNWLEAPDVRMYHIWHPSSSAAADRSPEAVAAMKHNRDIQRNDRTFVRNRQKSQYFPSHQNPIVSVIVRPKNTSREQLRGALVSYLYQTLDGVEVCVYSDDPCVQEAAQELPRVRIIRSDSEHFSLRSEFVAFSDGRCMWASDRLEKMLDHHSAVHPIVVDQTARWLTDDAEQLEPLLLKPGGPVLPHWENLLVRATLLQAINWRTGSEDGAFATLLASGAGVASVAETYQHLPLLAEEVELDERNRIDSASWLRNRLTQAGLSETLTRLMTAPKVVMDTLSQWLVSRTSLMIVISGGTQDDLSACRHVLEERDAGVTLRTSTTVDGLLVYSALEATLRDASALAKILEVSIARNLLVRFRPPSGQLPTSWQEFAEELLGHYESMHAEPAAWCVVLGDSKEDGLEDDLLRMPGASAALTRDLHLYGSSLRMTAARIPGGKIDSLLAMDNWPKAALHFFQPAQAMTRGVLS